MTDTPPGIDTTNQFMVGSTGCQTVIFRNPSGLALDSPAAFRLAAWLALVGEVNRKADEPTFEQIYEAVRNT
jgi:hypothetical protein